ncbi:hypothetical protein OOK13_43470 [Streptomyces sp. NBC_00378]|uniref:hypothetical protein n=1 Tax=unclassified Streptomyces TaxID=2593676 RepID=UPI00225A25E8|nr:MULTISPECIES: hypothetical protein [unclassified Streptomyces]MCX5115190.1 hypothetical protein [Streptomyces sp. NBC_00378]
MWREQLQVAEATASYLRPARQHFKPLPAPGTPVYRIAATRERQVDPIGIRLLPLLARARRTVIAHRATCTTCRADGRCAAGRELEIALRETEATAVLSREQQAHRDRIANEQRRVERRGEARARQRSLRQALPSVGQATRDRHNVPLPKVRPTTLVDEHELIRRAAAWPAPTHGGPGLPLKPLHI